MKTYVAMFQGQGGFWFSQGLYPLRDKLRKIGALADVFRYVDEPTAHVCINNYRTTGYQIALWGYSLGTSTVLYEQNHHGCDLAMCCAVSKLETEWPIDKAKTKRAILWHGKGVLSAGGTNMGFDVIREIPGPWVPVVSHLMYQIAPMVVDDTVLEVQELLNI